MRERRQVRLRDYDYSKSGYYFITICVKDREQRFGVIEGGAMRLNKFGEIARDVWFKIPAHFDEVKTDQFSVMPNHLHGILIIEEKMVGNAYMRSHQRNAYMHSLQGKTKMLLPKIIQQYKSSVTQEINSIQNGFEFGWQKSFYDHIIRSEKSLGSIREYIQKNPLKWDLDRENPLSGNFNLGHDDYWKEIYDSGRGNS